MHTRYISCQMLSIKFHVSLITHLYGSMSLLVSVCLGYINLSLPRLQEKRLHQFIVLLIVCRHTWVYWPLPDKESA